MAQEVGLRCELKSGGLDLAAQRRLVDPVQRLGHRESAAGLRAVIDDPVHATRRERGIHGAVHLRAVYTANFAEDADISAPETVARCLARAGGDAAALLAQAQSAESKQRLRAQTDAAIRLGIFGSPTFAVGEELFWGNDRLDDALRWAH